MGGVLILVFREVWFAKRSIEGILDLGTSQARGGPSVSEYLSAVELSFEISFDQRGLDGYAGVLRREIGQWSI